MAKAAETILTQCNTNNWDSMKKVVLSQNAPKPIGPYNQAVQAGNFMFVSGQLAIDPKDDKIVAKDVTRRVRLWKT